MVVEWRIKDVAQQRGITSAQELARRAHINKNTANALWNGRSLRIDRVTLASVCVALGCVPGDVLVVVNDDAGSG